MMVRLHLTDDRCPIFEKTTSVEKNKKTVNTSLKFKMFVFVFVDENTNHTNVYNVIYLKNIIMETL